MQVFDHGVELVSKGVVEPRDTKGKAAKRLRMVRRSQSYRGIIVSLGARNRTSEAEVEQRGDSPGSGDAPWSDQINFCPFDSRSRS